MATKQCPQCGYESDESARFCSSCGTKFESDSPSGTKTESDTTAPAQRPVVRRAPRIVMETPKQKRDIKKRTPLLVTIAFIIALLMVAAALMYYRSTQSENEQHAYDDAMASTAAVVLESYLSLYPNAPADHRNAVTHRLNMLNDTDAEWDSVLVRNTIGDYENYIARHPESIHTTEARLRVDSLHWLRAAADSTFEAYKAYITAHPDGIFVDEARLRAERLDPTNVSEEDKQRARVAIARYFKTLAACADNTVSYTVNDDIEVEKHISEGDSLSWHVTFNVDKKTIMADHTQSSLTVHKYEVTLSPSMEITDVSVDTLQ